MDFEQAIALVKEKSRGQGNELSTLEEVVLEAAWKDITYEEIGKERGVKPNTLKAYASGRLWKSLGALLNQKVRKKSFKKLLIAAIESGQLTATENNPLSRETEQSNRAGVTVSTVGARLPDVAEFYGRANELRDLKKLVESHACVLLVGVQGIGKKSLVSKLIQTQALPFSKILWKPLHHKPDVYGLEAELLELLETSEGNRPLISYLRKDTHLLIFDGFDSILEQKDGLRTIDSRYISLVRRIVEETPSQVICISEEPIEDFDVLILRGDAISYTLRGLKVADAEQMFESSFGVNVEEVVESVGGNPLLLKQIAAWSKESVQIDPSLVNRATVQRGVVKNWHEQVLASDYLSELDRQLLDTIAQTENGIPYSQLLTQYPNAAHRISRLLAMGLAHQKIEESGTPNLEVDAFFRKHLLAHS
ncbi:MAG: ATP-binding protein [Phormidesmis sp. RL_2_1]|nr:ATP-binding protein [Phormidesmis sp. RL_2_1]